MDPKTLSRIKKDRSDARDLTPHVKAGMVIKKLDTIEEDGRISQAEFLRLKRGSAVSAGGLEQHERYLRATTLGNKTELISHGAGLSHANLKQFLEENPDEKSLSCLDPKMYKTIPAQPGGAAKRYEVDERYFETEDLDHDGTISYTESVRTEEEESDQYMNTVLKRSAFFEALCLQSGISLEEGREKGLREVDIQRAFGSKKKGADMLDTLFYTEVLGEIPRDQREQEAQQLLGYMVPFPKDKDDLKEKCEQAWDQIEDWGEQDLAAILHTGLGERQRTVIRIPLPC